MIFSDYVVNELATTDMLTETIKKIGPDVRNGRLRPYHYETNRNDREIIWINGVPVEKPYLQPEKMHRHLGWLGRKRHKKPSKATINKINLAKHKRRIYNIQQHDSIKLPTGQSAK